MAFREPHPSEDQAAPPVTITCDHCGEDSPPEAIERQVGAALALLMRCRQCRYERRYAIVTARGIRLRDRLRAARDLWAETRHPAAYRKAERLARLFKREIRRASTPDRLTQ